MIFPEGRAVEYLSSKITAEMIISYLSKLHKIPATVFRISSPYGFENHSIINKIINNLKNKDPIFLQSKGKFSADFVLADDISKLVLNSIKNINQGIFNVGTNKRTSLTEIANIAKRILQIKENLILYDNSSISYEYETYPILNFDKAARVFNFNPTSIKNGILKIINS